MRLLLLYTLSLLLPCAALAIHPPSRENVIVVVNKNDEASLRIGEYYSKKRRIPKDNIIPLEMPAEEEISWAQYIQYIHNPLKAKLVEKKRIQASPLDVDDNLNREVYLTFDHNIDFLVLCKGVPLKIKNEPDLRNSTEKIPQQRTLVLNNASVDGELSLLAQDNTPILGYVQNPLFLNETPSLSDHNKIIRVARLDGPSEDSVKTMIDSALKGERRGLRGRVFIDRTGRYPKGNQWMDNIADGFEQLGYEVVINKEPNTLFKATDRFDGPVFYFGWWGGNADGPFKTSAFKFAPGAIAVHIHSFSAATLRSETANWVGPFVAKGVAATVGNVYEPYLSLTHHLDSLCDSLGKGHTLGEAAYYALPALSWQAILVGDPLYRPFNVKLNRQLSPSPLGAEDAYQQYAAIRQMKLIQRHFKNTNNADSLDDPNKPIRAAIQSGKKFFNAKPGMAIGFALAKLQADVGDYKGAKSTLSFVEIIQSYAPESHLLARDIAHFLMELGDSEKSLATYEALIEYSDPDPAYKKFIVQSAIEDALSIKQEAMARHWQQFL